MKGVLCIISTGELKYCDMKLAKDQKSTYIPRRGKKSIIVLEYKPDELKSLLNEWKKLHVAKVEKENVILYKIVDAEKVEWEDRKTKVNGITADEEVKVRKFLSGKTEELERRIRKVYWIEKPEIRKVIEPIKKLESEYNRISEKTIKLRNEIDRIKRENSDMVYLCPHCHSILKVEYEDFDYPKYIEPKWEGKIKVKCPKCGYEDESRYGRRKVMVTAWPSDKDFEYKTVYEKDVFIKEPKYETPEVKEKIEKIEKELSKLYKEQNKITKRVAEHLSKYIKLKEERVEEDETVIKIYEDFTGTTELVIRPWDQPSFEKLSPLVEAYLDETCFSVLP